MSEKPSDELRLDGETRDRQWREYCAREREQKKLRRAGKLPKPKSKKELSEAIDNLDEDELRATLKAVLHISQ